MRSGRFSCLTVLRFDSLQILTLAHHAEVFGGAALMSVNTAFIRLIYPQRFSVEDRHQLVLLFIYSAAAQQLLQRNPLHRILEMVIFNQRNKYYRPTGDAFLPPNGSRASKPMTCPAP